MTASAPVDDGRLAQAFIRGEAGAIKVIDHWIDTVLREHFHSLQNDWDDLRQEVRVRVLHNLTRGRFDSRSALSTYVHRIAKNVGIDFLRRASRRREKSDAIRMDEAFASPDSSIAAVMDREELAKILAGLTEEERRMVQLVFAEHCSYAEVARRLGIAEGTVKSRMSRCKDKMLQQHRRLKHRWSR